MLNNTYVAKSFYCLGDSLKKCFDCKYCRISDKKFDVLKYNTLPIEVNSKFNKIPIAINLFYGDPLLQINNTINILEQLEKVNYKGAVVIITKGNYNKFPDRYFNLDLHFAFSTFGIDHIYDGNTWDRFIHNLSEIKNRKYKYKYSIEFRPICYQINDDYTILEKVIKVASEYNLPMGYSGLQGKLEVVKYWEENNIELKPYPNYTFGHLKPLSDKVENNIRELAEKYNVAVFHKTSCLISYVHNYERDYNCHYYRQDEVNCSDCPMYDKCMKFKRELNGDSNKLKSIIPFDFEIEYKEKHECTLKKMGMCNYPTENCSNMSGYIIKIDKTITSADYRMVKWLTGYMVDAKFVQNEHLSDEWKEEK